MTNGAWGEAPKADFVRIGHDRYGIMLESDDGNHGHYYTTAKLMAVLNEEIKEIFSLSTSENTHASYACDRTANTEKDSPLCYDYDIKLNFAKEKNADYYDIRAVGNGVSGYGENSLISETKTVTYKFSEGKYRQFDPGNNPRITTVKSASELSTDVDDAIESNNN